MKYVYNCMVVCGYVIMWLSPTYTLSFLIMCTSCAQCPRELFFYASPVKNMPGGSPGFSPNNSPAFSVVNPCKVVLAIVKQAIRLSYSSTTEYYTVYSSNQGNSRPHRNVTSHEYPGRIDC